MTKTVAARFRLGAGRDFLFDRRPRRDEKCESGRRIVGKPVVWEK